MSSEEGYNNFLANSGTQAFVSSATGSGHLKSDIRGEVWRSYVKPDKKFKSADFFLFKRQNGDLIISLFFFLLTLILLIYFNSESGFEDRKLPQKRFGKILKQGWVAPAVCMFFLTIAVTVNLILSVHNAIKSKRLHLPKRTSKELLKWLKSLEFVGYFLIYTFVIPTIGYLLSTVIFAVALTWRLGYRSLRWVSISFLTAVGIVLVFRTFLQIKTPLQITLYEFFPPAVESFLKTYF
jgi:hypothetical protein